MSRHFSTRIRHVKMVGHREVIKKQEKQISTPAKRGRELDRLNVGIVGLGDNWESRYRPALRQLMDRLKVQAICDPVARRAELAAQESAASAVDSFQALVRRSDVSAVLILGPGWFGPLPAFASCVLGKPVFLANPTELSLDEVREIRRRAIAGNAMVMVGFGRRLSPATIRLKELAATRLGAPQIVFCHRRLPMPALPIEKIWRLMLRELVEQVDWCNYIIGRPARWVMGVAFPQFSGEHPAGYTMLSLDYSEESFGTGPIAQISCGCYFPSQWQEAIHYRPPPLLQVRCRNGVAFVDPPSTVVWFDEAGQHFETVEQEKSVEEQLLLHFYWAATQQGCRPSELDDAYRAILTVHEAQRSFREGRRLELTFQESES